MRVRLLSTDGAAQGIRPTRALDTIIGGQAPPAPEEGMDMDALYEWIQSVPDGPAQNYDDAARIMAKAMLEFVQTSSLVSDFRAMGYEQFRERWLAEREDHYRAADKRALGCTAFQFGWAYNAVRTILDMEPAGNPALAEIG